MQLNDNTHTEDIVAFPRERAAMLRHTYIA